LKWGNRGTLRRPERGKLDLRKQFPEISKKDKKKKRPGKAAGGGGDTAGDLDGPA